MKKTMISLLCIVCLLTVPVFAEENQYTISFYAPKATSGTMSPQVCEGTCTLNKNEFSRTNYLFLGWNTEEDLSGTFYEDGQEITVQSDMSLYAVWAKEKYQVIFMPNKATSGSMKDPTYKRNRTYTLPSNTFKRKGYSFVGWNTQADGSGTFYEDGQEVINMTTKSKITLYAQWKKKTYTISYDLNKGYFTDATLENTAYRFDTTGEQPVSRYTVTSADWSLPKPKRTGYTFSGWYTNENWTTKVTKITKGTTGSKTYYARYKANTYDIVYVGYKASSGSTKDNTCTYNKACTLSANGFKRKGYKFTGWNTEKDGSGTAYKNKEVVKNLATSGTVYLYPQWIPINYIEHEEFVTDNGFEGVIDKGEVYIDGVLVVNKTYGIRSTYKPKDTRGEISGAYVEATSNGLTKETYSAFKKMRNAAADAGYTISLSSCYRSFGYQEGLYNMYKNRDGKAAADRYSARPGFSEHQTGLAFDLNTIGHNSDNTSVTKWVHKNCWKYGFIVRYPKGKESKTGYMYEWWHLRYVGAELAEKLYNGGKWITLEEYFGITSEYK
ncbi:MAG: InlB B-repeat-containing protein [Erysipelotrichaceae bacterium]|nr:InlB B-repeat-containing protein [Erysipelotrichaceae bacterium]